MELPGCPELGDKDVTAKDLVSWLKDQDDPSVEVTLPRLFDQLVELASRPKYASSKACVKLCGFVDHCTKSERLVFRAWAFSHGTALRLFEFYVEWNEQDQHRSMRLVLDLLTHLIIRNLSEETGQSITRAVLNSLVSILVGQSTRPLIKSSLTALNHLLARSVATLDDVLETYRRIQPSVSELSDLILCQRFASEIFGWLKLQYVCSAAGKFLVNLFKNLKGAATCPRQDSDLGTFTVAIWLEWLQTALSTDPEMLENIKNYVFSPLFRAERSSSLELLELMNRLRLSTGADKTDLDITALLQLSALEIGKKEGLVEDPGHAGITDASKKILLNEEILENVLSHRSHGIRSLALSLLVSSSSTIRPYSRVALGLLRKHLGRFHADPDPKFRYEVLGHTKDMITRVKSTIPNMQRILSRAPEKMLAHGYSSQIKQIQNIFGSDEGVLRETLAYHEAFLQWYLDFLRRELVPTASYQRHIMALKATMLIFQLRKDVVSQHDTLDTEIVVVVSRDFKWVRSILDLIMDPFDDVRETATALLMSLSPEIVSAQVSSVGLETTVTLIEIVEEFCVRATELSGRTARADHADGSARSQGLLCSWLNTTQERLLLLSDILRGLEAKVYQAERNLGYAALQFPVHGDFASIRFIWSVLVRATYSEHELSEFADIQRRIVRHCRRMWNLVRHVLCDDSPEGHLPQEMEDVEGLDTKDLLSYSFRSIHEASNTMRALMSTLKSSRDIGTLYPPFDVFKEIGSLAFDQLSNLRHRGAFTTVSQTFITCCQSTQDPSAIFSDDDAASALLNGWYQGTLSCIFQQASTTRRSAGIPSLMTGILAANASHPSLEEVIWRLEEISETPARVPETDGSNLPQVHALNCLKDVFKSSLLSKRASKYLPEVFQLATNCLQSEIWAIRNCGLLLIRSLIDNLFGTGESKAVMESGWDGKTVRISYKKYPTLPGVLASLLRSVDPAAMEAGLQNAAAESVFPVLDIIRRAGPPEAARDELYGYITQYLKSHLWHVREIAARTLCSFLICDDWVKSIQELLKSSLPSMNGLHGVLLTIKFLLERVSEVGSETFHEDIARLKPVLRKVPQDMLENCQELTAALIEILNIISRTSPAQSLVLDLPVGSPGSIPSALLQNRLSVEAVYQSAFSRDMESLRSTVTETLEIDSNTACTMLEAIPAIWKTETLAPFNPELCRLYFDVALQSHSPDLCALALESLAESMDKMILKKQVTLLPDDQELTWLWRTVQAGQINPALSQAVLRVSGPIMAVLTLRAAEDIPPALQAQLRAWGGMISDAGDMDESFDTRYAAILSLKSYILALGERFMATTNMIAAFALYDTLSDDDEEIRDLGASAASALFTSRGVELPMEAANVLLETMASCFGDLDEFRLLTAGRMSGNPAAPGGGIHSEGGGSTWEPAEAQLQRAMKFDNSLFVIEKQNLFIDEVRETSRWCSVFDRIQGRDLGGAAEKQLGEWTLAGIRSLLQQAREDDGPLGWTSTPDVFAICTRLIQCGTSLVKLGGHAELQEALGRLGAVGLGSRFHGSLLSMLEQSGDA